MHIKAKNIFAQVTFQTYDTSIAIYFLKLYNYQYHDCSETLTPQITFDRFIIKVWKIIW